MFFCRKQVQIDEEALEHGNDSTYQPSVESSSSDSEHKDSKQALRQASAAVKSVLGPRLEALDSQASIDSAILDKAVDGTKDEESGQSSEPRESVNEISDTTETHVAEEKLEPGQREEELNESCEPRESVNENSDTTGTRLAEEKFKPGQRNEELENPSEPRKSVNGISKTTETSLAEERTEPRQSAVNEPEQKVQHRHLLISPYLPFCLFSNGRLSVPGALNQIYSSISSSISY